MANENLNINIKATDNASATIKNVNSAMKKTTGNVKRQGQAFTQLAYALDDAQYGFRGIQNNIQQIAVTAGAGGPLVLAITAATVAVGYFIDKWSDANKEAKDTIDDIEKRIEGLRDSLGISTRENEVTQLIEEYSKARTKIQNELERLNSRTFYYDSTTGTTKSERVGTDEEIRKQQTKLSQLEKEHQRDLQRIRDKASAEQNKRDAERRKRKYKQEQEEEKRQVAALSKIRAAYTHGHLIGDFRDIIGTGVGQNDFGGGVDPFSGSLFNIENFTNEARGFFSKARPVVEDGAAGIGDALKGALQQAFIGVGEAIGNALGGIDNGGFLDIVASFMNAFGAALIAIGTAKLTLEANAPGGLLIAAGIGLVAAATLLSAGGAGHFSGSKSQNSRRSYTSPSANATRVQGVGGSERLIGELELRGQNLLVALQAASETRNRF